MMVSFELAFFLPSSSMVRSECLEKDTEKNIKKSTLCQPFRTDGTK